MMSWLICRQFADGFHIAAFISAFFHYAFSFRLSGWLHGHYFLSDVFAAITLLISRLFAV
jgi:hypothetical protein